MSTNTHPTIFKRLLATFYDAFLLLATMFIATALTMPFTKGEIGAGNNIYMSLYLLIVIYIFYGWFWTHGGQTLGMRAWNQRLVQFDGTTLTWQQTFIRLLTGLPSWLLLIIGTLLWLVPEKINIAESLIGIPNWMFALTGIIWVLLENRSHTWRDNLSGTHVISTDKKK